MIVIGYWFSRFDGTTKHQQNPADMTSYPETGGAITLHYITGIYENI